MTFFLLYLLIFALLPLRFYLAKRDLHTQRPGADLFRYPVVHLGAVILVIVPLLYVLIGRNILAQHGIARVIGVLFVPAVIGLSVFALYLQRYTLTIRRNQIERRSFFNTLALSPQQISQIAIHEVIDVDARQSMSIKTLRYKVALIHRRGAAPVALSCFLQEPAVLTHLLIGFARRHKIALIVDGVVDDVTQPLAKADEILRTSRTTRPEALQTSWWIPLTIAVAFFSFIGLFVKMLEASQAHNDRENAISLMQAECAKNCEAYGVTERSLGEPTRLTDRELFKLGVRDSDRVYQWHDASGTTLSVQQMDTLPEGRTFPKTPDSLYYYSIDWHSSAPQRDEKDVDTRLSQVAEALSQVVSDQPHASRRSDYAGQLTLNFMISPNGHAYHVRVVNYPSDGVQYDYFEPYFSDIISRVDFGAGRYAALDKSYVVPIATAR